jgi:multiple sugar transport system permease protein
LAAPFALGIVALVVLPAAATLVLALFEWDLITDPKWVGLQNARRLSADPIFRIALRNSIAFVAVAVPLRVLAAFAAALALHGSRKWSGAPRTLVLSPSVMPDVAYALVWLWLANPLYGPLAGALDALGVPAPRWLTDPGDTQALVIVMSLFTVGEGFVVLLAVRNAIPAQLYEVAAIEGLPRRLTFRRLTLPAMAPALTLLAVRDAALSLHSTFTPSLVVTDGGPPPFSTTYLPLLAYRTSFEYLRYGYGAAMTVVMLALTLLAIVVIRGTASRATSVTFR